jgi:hypothetical protein
MSRPSLAGPAIAITTGVLVLCCVGWGVLGLLSTAAADDLMTLASERYVLSVLQTVTVGAIVTNLTARLVRAVREERGPTDDGYAQGYLDGLSARGRVSGQVVTLPRHRRS